MFVRVNWRLRQVPWFTKGYAPTRPFEHSHWYRYQRINHAGFDRDIISRNPPLIDDDGYEVDSEEDDERAQAAIAMAAEFDPYAEVKIESEYNEVAIEDSANNHLSRSTCATDSCIRPTRPSYSFKALYLENSHRTYSTSWRDGTKGESFALED